VGLGGAEQRLHRAGRQDVVTVQEHHVRGGGRVDAVVARAAAAAAVDRPVDHPQAWLPVGEGVEEGRAAVRRAVVHGDDLAHGRALRECRADGVRHMGGVVVPDDDNADLRLVRGHVIHGPES